MKPAKKPALTDNDRQLVLEQSRSDPVWWVENWLGDKPWSSQVRILRALKGNKEVAVKSCHGAGKDWIAARAVLWFLYTHYPSIVITTGPTDRQVRGILWKEIQVAHVRSRNALPGVPLQQELRLAPNWWAWGFTAPHRDPDRFQGFHEENVLVVIDEACGVSEEIYTAIEGVLSSENARKLEIGNPTNILTPFGKSFTRPGVRCISISAFDTPNFTDAGIVLDDIRTGEWRNKTKGKLTNPKLVSPEWAARAHANWGESSPLFQSRVLGQFPRSAQDSLIPLDIIEAAQRAELKPSTPHVLGVDVARYGDDLSVIAERRGPVVRIIEVFGKTDTMETSGRVVMALQSTGAEEARIDTVGIGAGVFDRLKELGKPVVEACAGEKANDADRYINARAEWFWNLRTLAETENLDLDPMDEDTAAELSAIRWKPDSRGRVQIEKKEDMKRRGVKSPNRADAIAIACADIRTSCWSFSF